MNTELMIPKGLYLYKLSVTYVSIQTSVFRDGKEEG